MSYNLFYLAKAIYGGWISFTAHLALKHELNIYKIKNHTETKLRPFGYGLHYKNTEVKDVSQIHNPIIVAVDKNHYKYLSNFADGTWIVIHDPSEIKKKDCKQLIENLRRFRIITIRESVKKYLYETYNLTSLFLVHPFYPYEFRNPVSASNAVSTARIDYDKNTDIILRANSMLSKSKQIALYGFANKRYVHFKLNDLQFQNAYKGIFTKSFDSLNTILNNAKFCIDMSVIKHDGGGTQYTFLESIYHNVALVINSNWIEGYDTIFEDKRNCYVIKNAEELAELINKNVDTSNVTKHARDILEPHIKVNWIERLNN
jgi:hypothetical protein